MNRSVLPLAVCLLVAGGGLFVPATVRAQESDKSRVVRPAIDRVLTAKDLGMTDECFAQFQALMAEKESRTPAQQKIDSQLLYSAKMRRDEPIAARTPQLSVSVTPDVVGRADVEIVAPVTKGLIRAILSTGGEIVVTLSKDNLTYATVPIDALEWLAERSDVQAINRVPVAVTNTGSVNSEGDTTHVAGDRMSGTTLLEAGARTIYGATGSNTIIGMLSNSNTAAPTSQSNGNLPASPQLQDISGQTGPTGASSEGTAMLEIGYDLAPNAGLRFATAGTLNAAGSGSPNLFADNIRALATAGCKVIVDDVSYPTIESPFADTVITKAVDEVTATGVLYFSSAGNQGNTSFPGFGGQYVANTSSCWEGDFSNAGTAPAIFGAGKVVHQFATGVPYNTVRTGAAVGLLTLFWSDPYFGSSNDYDLYVTDSGGTSVVKSSANLQTGSSSQNPVEYVQSLSAGQRIYVVRAVGASDRAINLSGNDGNAFGGSFTYTTSGQTRGHSQARNAFCVAAAPATNDYGYGGPYSNAFTGTSPYEYFTSDGPRRVFYTASGSTGSNTFSSVAINGALTIAGNGGEVRLKPDITGADGVKTTVNTTASSQYGVNFNPFYGTSAAAPHTAALAALLLSYRSANATAAANVPTGVTIDGSKFTGAELRQILLAGCLDNTFSGNAVGWDKNTGYGILMPKKALAFVTAFTNNNLVQSSSTNTTATITWTTALSADSIIEYGTTSGSYPNNASGASGTSHSVTITGLTAGTGYFYRVRSKTGATDATSGAIFVSPERSFATSGATTAPRIGVSAITKSRNGSVVTLGVTLSNSGSASATATQITSATLAGTNTSTGLPLSYGTIAAGGTATQSLTFSGVAAGSRLLVLNGTASGRAFSITVAVTIP